MWPRGILCSELKLSLTARYVQEYLIFIIKICIKFQESIRKINKSWYGMARSITHTKEEGLLKTITLKELCRQAGVSRRVIQGYEKAGILHEQGYNKMGHLLYDEREIAHVKRVRIYQQAGFSLKEIKDMEKMERIELIKVLTARLQELKGNASRLELYIQKLSEEGMEAR